MATIPLAERMRPRSIAEILGQEHLLSEGAVLLKAIRSGRLPSMILWGPPGVGKTTLARVIAGEGGGRKNKSTQLRKFYDELVMWHDKVFAHGADRGATYRELAPFIKMLCAKVTYAKGRDHVSEGFEKLFTHVIRAVDGPETLKQAKLFIEAFMGFYKAEEK